MLSKSAISRVNPVLSGNSSSGIKRSSYQEYANELLKEKNILGLGNVVMCSEKYTSNTPVSISSKSTSNSFSIFINFSNPFWITLMCLFSEPPIFIGVLSFHKRNRILPRPPLVELLLEFVPYKYLSDRLPTRPFFALPETISFTVHLDNKWCRV